MARVAVMRRLCESLWHMLGKKEHYRLVDYGVDDGGKKTRRPAA